MVEPEPASSRPPGGGDSRNRDVLPLNQWGEMLKGCDSNAENAVRPLLAPSGELVALLTVKETQKYACYLAGQAKDRQLVTLIEFTFDLPELCVAIQVGLAAGAKFEIIADHRSGMGSKTRDQVARLRALRAAGVKVFTASGAPIKEEYTAVGRSVPPGTGILHAKVIRSGKQLLIGSANWTTSSRCNREMNVLIRLSSAGEQAFQAEYEKLRSISAATTDATIAEAEANVQEQMEKRAASRRSRSLDCERLGRSSRSSQSSRSPSPSP